MIKSFMDSVVTSINVRIDGVLKDVAQLKASLEFSQKEDENETWDETEAKVKNVLDKNAILNLLQKLNVLIVQVIPGGTVMLKRRPCRLQTADCRLCRLSVIFLLVH